VHGLYLPRSGPGRVRSVSKLWAGVGPSYAAVGIFERKTFIFMSQNAQTHPCPRNRSSFLEQGFQGQKPHSKGEIRPMSDLFPYEYNHFPWFDPRRYPLDGGLLAFASE
jgi:hypothetical protein